MFELLTLDYDRRVQSYCALARCNYRWFLQITGGAERNLEIQRGIIKGTKSYQTLRADLKRGCLLPALVLAVKNVAMPTALLQQAPTTLPSATLAPILDELKPNIERVSPGDVYIIDGLQRTNAIKQTLEEIERGQATDAFLSNTARLEIWLNIPFGALAYRMLLLNAGQRPMSIKNQVEILSMKLQEELADIPGLIILSSIEAERRVSHGQFHLSKLSQAFQAWLQGTPNVDLRNLVMEQLLVESAIETLGSSLAGQRNQDETDEFKSFVRWVVSVDSTLAKEVNFFGNETVLQGIAAAVGASERNPTLRDRMKRALAALATAAATSPDSDVLGVSSFEALRRGIDPAKVNVGQATREMVFKAFQEHFISDGFKSMPECWGFAAGAV